MTKRLQSVDISELGELRRLAEEVQMTEEARALQVDHETVAILAPVPHRSSRRGQSTSATDPLWNIVGLAQSEAPGDVAENIDGYLVHDHSDHEG